MYVCVCKAVTDRHITEAVNQGARRLKDLRQSLGITEECGRCAVCAKDCLNAALGLCPNQRVANDQATCSTEGGNPA